MEEENNVVLPLSNARTRNANVLTKNANGWDQSFVLRSGEDVLSRVVERILFAELAVNITNTVMEIPARTPS